MQITIVSKDPPGGRCLLYGLYAQCVTERCGATVEIVYPVAGSAIGPPALLIDGLPIVPDDGLIL